MKSRFSLARIALLAVFTLALTASSSAEAAPPNGVAVTKICDAVGNASVQFYWSGAQADDRQVVMDFSTFDPQWGPGHYSVIDLQNPGGSQALLVGFVPTEAFYFRILILRSYGVWESSQTYGMTAPNCPALLSAAAAGSSGGSSTFIPPAVNPTSDADFCRTHSCIPNFDNGQGYIVQCADGMYSQSGGIQGSCSGHGGNR